MTQSDINLEFFNNNAQLPILYKAQLSKNEDYELHTVFLSYIIDYFILLFIFYGILWSVIHLFSFNGQAYIPHIIAATSFVGGPVCISLLAHYKKNLIPLFKKYSIGYKILHKPLNFFMPIVPLADMESSLISENFKQHHIDLLYTHMNMIKEAFKSQENSHFFLMILYHCLSNI